MFNYICKSRKINLTIALTSKICADVVYEKLNKQGENNNN